MLVKVHGKTDSGDGKVKSMVEKALHGGKLGNGKNEINAAEDANSGTSGTVTGGNGGKGRNWQRIEQV